MDLVKSELFVVMTCTCNNSVIRKGVKLKPANILKINFYLILPPFLKYDACVLFLLATIT